MITGAGKIAAGVATCLSAGARAGAAASHTFANLLQAVSGGSTAATSNAKGGSPADLRRHLQEASHALQQTLRRKLGGESLSEEHPLQITVSSDGELSISGDAELAEAAQNVLSGDPAARDALRQVVAAFRALHDAQFPGGGVLGAQSWAAAGRGGALRISLAGPEPVVAAE